VVSAVTLAWQAAREQRLHLTRGGARKSGTGPAGPTRLSLDDYVLATCYRQHLGMPCRLIGEILGVHESSISLATGRIAPLLTQQGITIHPPPASAPSMTCWGARRAQRWSLQLLHRVVHVSGSSKLNVGQRHALNPERHKHRMLVLLECDLLTAAVQRVPDPAVDQLSIIQAGRPPAGVVNSLLDEACRSAESNHTCPFRLHDYLSRNVTGAVGYAIFRRYRLTPEYSGVHQS